MIRLFKKYFIPHKRNDHRPHIFRIEATLIILGLVLLIETYFLAQAFFIAPFANFFASITPDALVNLTNFNRQADNLPFLKTNSLLGEAAQLKANDMATKGYFAHQSPEGLTPWFWLAKAGYRYSFAGENLAINFVDSQDAQDAWMNSPLHRANILNVNFTEIGIASARGVYQGKETTFVVEMFGRPALTSETETITPPKIITPPAVKANENEAYSPPVPAPEELFVAVKGATAVVPTSAPEKNEPLKLSFAARLLSAPRRTTNFLYFMLLTILALALFLTIFIKIKIQHPKLIINGVILLLIISSVIWINQYIAVMQAKIF